MPHGEPRLGFFLIPYYLFFLYTYKTLLNIHQPGGTRLPNTIGRKETAIGFFSHYGGRRNVGHKKRSDRGARYARLLAEISSRGRWVDRISKILKVESGLGFSFGRALA